jgi:Rrf2 family protein
MRLTKTTSHAIRIAIDCAEAKGALIKVTDIAARLDITQLNVFKIVHILSHAGFVEAVRGRNGGVRLARAATDIRIGDIVRATEATGMEVAGAEGAARSGKAGGKAPLNEIFDVALVAFISVLDQHTLADMAKGARAVSTEPRTVPKKALRKTTVTTNRPSAQQRS